MLRYQISGFESHLFGLRDRAQYRRGWAVFFDNHGNARGGFEKMMSNARAWGLLRLIYMLWVVEMVPRQVHAIPR